MQYNGYMKYTYSAHSIERMEERNISKIEVEALLDNLVDRLVSKSKSDDQAILYMGFVEQKGIVVVLNPKTNNVITVRRIRKNEEKYFYNKKKGV